METNIETPNDTYREKYKTELEHLAHIKNAIAQELKNRNLTCEYKFTNNYQELQNPELLIHSDTEFYKDYFEACIHSSHSSYHGKDRAHFWVKTYKSFPEIVGKYSDGSEKWESNTIQFDNFLCWDYAQSIGLEKIDYTVRLHQLSLDFKALKNPKLIVKDIMSAVDIYTKVIEHVKPKIEARRQHEKNTLDLLNFVAAKANRWLSEKPQDREFDFVLPDGSKFSIGVSQYGDISLTKDLSFDDLTKVLEHALPKDLE